MAFLTTRFPEEIAFGARGGPGFSTNVIMLGGGQEQRNRNWSKARLQWDVSYGIKTQTDYEELLSFFLAAGGRANTFRFKDWTDYRVPSSSPETLGTSDGASDQTFQLRKTYTVGSDSYVRPVTRPVASAFVLYFDGVAQGSGWSLDADTGLVTVTSDPAEGTVYSWSGEFDVPCRFDTDDMSVSYDDYNNYNWPRVPVIEVRETYASIE